MLGNAGADVAVKQLLVKRVKRRLNGGNLNQDIGTVGVVFEHFAYSAYLPLYPVQPIGELSVFLRLSVLFFTFAAIHIIPPYIRLYFNLSAFPTTQIELNDIASPANIGLSSR